MLILGTVRATDDALVEDATIDIWETNGNGFYDMQDPNLDRPDCQGVFHNDRNGRYYLLRIFPIANLRIDYNISRLTIPLILISPPLCTRHTV
jgi:protocatechuate 3,4-dioxygenase beta subunit